MKKITTFISAFTFLALMFSNIQTYAVKHIVNVQNITFSPSTLNVSVGDTVRWVWINGTHTTTSVTIPAGANTWDQPITSTNTFYEYPVTVAGTYNYECSIHAAMGMTATFTATSFVPTLAVTPSNRNVSAAAGTATFSVTSNSNWTASCNTGWCTCTPGGSGNGAISANYTMNTSVTQRVSTITVTVAGLPDQTVTVTQAGAAPSLSVGPANQNVAATSGVATFNVVSNTTWISSSNAAWCSVTPSGNGNGPIIATYEANSTNLVRVATITTTVSGLTPQSVTVTQAAGSVGVDEQAMSNIRVYPNPTKGIFKVNVGNFRDKSAEVTFMDINGKTILNKVCSGATEYSFDLSQESRGYYFARITINDNTTIRRIVLIN